MSNSFVKVILSVFVGLALLWPAASFAGRAEGVDINRFDVQPRTINVGQSLRFTLLSGILQQLLPLIMRLILLQIQAQQMAPVMSL